MTDKCQIKQVVTDMRPIIVDWVKKDLELQNLHNLKTVAELAKIFRKTPATIKRWIKDLGIEPGFVPPGERPMYNPLDFNTLKRN